MLKHYYDGALLDQVVQLREEHGFSAHAVLGDADTIGIVVEDPAGTLDFVGDKRWVMIEDACPVGAQTVWRGYTGKQSISGGGGTGTIYPDGVGRRWNLDLIEDNTCLGFRIVTGTDGKRPDETVSRRLTWLLASPYLSGIVVDHGLVGSSTVALDDHDYRGQNAADVLGDLAIATGYNFYARYREASDDVEIAFYDADTSALDSATLRISNDPADIDYVTTWPAAPTVAAERDPSRYARGIYLPYAKGAVYVGGGPGLRDMTAPSATVKTAAKATTLATRLLAQHAEQDEKLSSVRVRLPAANLNDVRHGQRIEVRQTHLPGWTAFRSARVLSKAFGRPDSLTQAFYDVDLDLSSPTRCRTYAGATTPTGHYPALGSATSAADGYIAYLRPGVVYPQEPTPYFAGAWHFPEFHPPSGPDYAGDCVLNTVRCFVVGEGQITVQTRPYGAVARNLVARLWHLSAGVETQDGASVSLTAGDAATFSVSTHEQAFCVHWVSIGEDTGGCGSKWGFDGFDWVKGLQ